MRASLYAATHEAGSFENPYVLRRGGKGHSVWRGELANIVFAGGKTTQHRAPRSIG